MEWNGAETCMLMFALKQIAWCNIVRLKADVTQNLDKKCLPLHATSTHWSPYVMCLIKKTNQVNVVLFCSFFFFLNTCCTFPKGIHNQGIMRSPETSHIFMLGSLGLTHWSYRNEHRACVFIVRFFSGHFCINGSFFFFFKNHPK